MECDIHSLPVAHTCFFSMDLPNYDSYELLKSKITYAMNNAIIITDSDADLLIDL